MGKVGEEGSNFTLGIVRGTNGTKVRIEPKSIQESRTGVKAFTGTARVSLINDAIKEGIGHHIRDRNATRGGRDWSVARAFLAPVPTVVSCGAAVAPFAAA